MYSPIDTFFSQTFDVRSSLRDQKDIVVPLEVLASIGTTPQDWMKNWEVIAKYFDVLEWWHNTGKMLYPLIHPVACFILCLPDSNGEQERNFSTGNWADGNLQQRQTDLTFQMKVLIQSNMDFIMEHLDNVEKEQRKAAEKRTRELLDMFASKKKSSDIDEELDDLMDAYRELVLDDSADDSPDSNL